MVNWLPQFSTPNTNQLFHVLLFWQTDDDKKKKKKKKKSETRASIIKYSKKLRR